MNVRHGVVIHQVQPNEVLPRKCSTPGLKRLARRSLRRERPNHTLQPTELVNEAYIRLVDQRGADWQSRSHFFAIAARIMRRVLVDHARKRLTDKRGAGLSFVPLDDHTEAPSEPVSWERVLAVHEALDRLESMSPRQAKIVELRYFGGLTREEVADVLAISRATVQREWSVARVWFARELSQRES